MHNLLLQPEAKTVHDKRYSLVEAYAPQVDRGSLSCYLGNEGYGIFICVLNSAVITYVSITSFFFSILSLEYLNITTKHILNFKICGYAWSTMPLVLIGNFITVM